MIFAPIDGSTTSDLGLQEAIKLGTLTGVKLRLIHGADERSHTRSHALSEGYGIAYPGDILDLLRVAGSEILSMGQAQVQAHGLELDTVLKASVASRVCDLVLAQARSCGADLIVLGTHGRRGLWRLFMGSSTIPVLLLRADLTADKAGARAYVACAEADKMRVPITGSAGCPSADCSDASH